MTARTRRASTPSRVAMRSMISAYGVSGFGLPQREIRSTTGSGCGFRIRHLVRFDPRHDCGVAHHFPTAAKRQDERSALEPVTLHRLCLAAGKKDELGSRGGRPRKQAEQAYRDKEMS